MKNWQIIVVGLQVYHRGYSLTKYLVQTSWKMILKNYKQRNTLIVQIFYNLQNHPPFHSEGRLVNLARGWECFVGLSTSILLLVLLVYLRVYYY